MEIQELFNSVRQWGIDRKITGPEGKGTLLGQLTKTQEELTETRDAAVCLFIHEQNSNPLAVNDAWDEIKDGIGDTIVTLILAAELAGLTAEECLQHAFDQIKGRTGKMVDGQFVKDAK